MRIKGRRPSPSMVVAGAALVAALAGTAIAGPFATKSVLSKADKKQVKKIAKNQVNSLASGLSVASANTANNANNANALNNVTLADLIPDAEGEDGTCEPTATFGTDCVGATLTTTRTADIIVLVSGTWHSDDAAGANIDAGCRIERNDVGGFAGTVTFGTNNNDTVEFQYERTLLVSETDENRPPGTYEYELSCDENEGDFDIRNLTTQVLAVGT